MPDFHIPHDPEWQWVYDLILYGVGEEFPQADPTQLRAMGDDLYQFTNTLLGGMAATANLGNALSAHQDGPAAEAFGRFSRGITQSIPQGANISTSLGGASYQFALDSESTQYGIVIAAFTQVVEIAIALSSGFGAPAVPGLIKIGQEIVKTLIEMLSTRLRQVLQHLVWEAVEEGLEELWQSAAGQIVQMAEGHRHGFDYKDLGMSFAGGAFIGGGVAGMHMIGGKFFPKFTKNVFGGEVLSGGAETLFEGLFSTIVGGGGFNPGATFSSSIIGGMAHNGAYEIGQAIGPGTGGAHGDLPPSTLKSAVGSGGNTPPALTTGVAPPTTGSGSHGDTGTPAPTPSGTGNGTEAGGSGTGAETGGTGAGTGTGTGGTGAGSVGGTGGDSTSTGGNAPSTISTGGNSPGGSPSGTGQDGNSATGSPTGDQTVTGNNGGTNSTGGNTNTGAANSGSAGSHTGNSTTTVGNVGTGTAGQPDISHSGDTTIGTGQSGPGDQNTGNPGDTNTGTANTGTGNPSSVGSQPSGTNPATGTSETTPARSNPGSGTATTNAPPPATAPQTSTVVNAPPIATNSPAPIGGLPGFDTPAPASTTTNPTMTTSAGGTNPAMTTSAGGTNPAIISPTSTTGPASASTATPGTNQAGTTTPSTTGQATGNQTTANRATPAPNLANPATTPIQPGPERVVTPPPPPTEIGLVTPIVSPVAPQTPEPATPAPQTPPVELRVAPEVTAPAPQAEVQATPPAPEAPAPAATPITAAPALADEVDPDLPPSSSAPSSLRRKADAPKIATAPNAQTNPAYGQRATPADDVLARENYGAYFQQLNSSLEAGKPLAYVVNTILPVSDVSKIPAMIRSVVTGLQDPAGATGRIGFVFGVNTKASADESASRLAEIDEAITHLRDSDAMRPFARYPIAFVASTFEGKFPAGTMRNEVLNSAATLDLLAGFLKSGHHPYVSVQDSDASSRLVSPTGPHVFDHFETLLAPADQQVQTYLDTLSPQSPTDSDVDMAVDEAAAQADPPFRPLMMAGGYRPDDLQAQLDAARNDPPVDEDVAEELNDLAAHPDKITAAIDKVRADMVARQAQAKVHPLLPYAPEPNLFIDGLAVMVDTELQFGPKGAEFDHLAKQLTTFAAGELHQSFAAAHKAAEVDLPVPDSKTPTTVDVPMAQDQTDIHESVAVHGGSTTLPIRGPAFVVDFVDGAVSTDLLRLARGLLRNSTLPQSHAAPAHPVDRFFDSKKAKTGTKFAAVADRAGLKENPAADDYYQTSEPLRPIRHDDTAADSTVPDVSEKDKKDLGNRSTVNVISGALAHPVTPWAETSSETPFGDVTFGIDPLHKDRAAYESVAGNPAGRDQRMQRYRDNEVDAESETDDMDTAQDTLVGLTDQLDDVTLVSKRRREETGSPEPDAAPPPGKRREMLPPTESSAPGKTPGPATEPESVDRTGHLLGDAAQPESAWASRAADVKPARISTERFDPGLGGRRNGPTPTGGMAPDNLTIDRHGPGWLDGALTHIASDVRRVQADDGAWVQEHTVRLEIAAFDPSVRTARQGAPDGSTASTPADVAAVREAAARAVDEHLNGKYRLPNGDQLHVRVEFVDPPAPGGSHPADAQPHASVWVHTGTDDARQFHWPVSAVTSGESGVFAHEVLHFLGAADTYHDREMLFRRPPAGPDSRVPTALTDNPHDSGPGLMGRAARSPAPVLTPGDLDRIHQATQSAVRVPEAPVDGPTAPTPAARPPEGNNELDLPPSSAAPPASRPEADNAQQTVVRDLLSDPQRLPGITVMIDEAMNFGHQTAGISLIESLRKLGYHRNVTVVASPGVWAKVDRLLPADTPNITRVTQDEFLAGPTTYTDQRPAGTPSPLVLVGASDTIDARNADSFLNYMGADQAVVFQPYAWQNGRRLAFSRSGPDAPATVTDLGEGTIPEDAIFNTDMPDLDVATATATIRAGVATSELADALVTVATAAIDKTIDVMPVYGLHRLDMELRPGAGMALAHGVHAAGLGHPAVILEISESDVDFSPARDANQTPPWLSTVDLRAGEPLTLDGLNPGDVVVVRTGPLRKDVFQTAYQLGSLPAVLEGANTANLVQLLDRPYFSPRPEDTGFLRTGDPADAAQIDALTVVADAIRKESPWSAALKAEQVGPYQDIATIATATSVLTSRSQAIKDYPGEEDFLLGDEFDRLRAALPSRLDEVVSIFGGSPEAIAAAQPVTGMSQKQRTAALERQIPVTEDMIQQLHALLNDERADLVNRVRDRYQHHSTDPAPESVTAIATAINDLRNPDSALRQYFDRVAASARDPRRDQVLQGLSHFAANQPGATVGSRTATSSHTEVEDRLRDTDYPFLLDVNPLRDQGGELTTNCYVAAIATDMSLASGGIDRFQAGGAVASPSEFLSNYAGRPLDTVRDLDQVRDILTAAGPGARGIVTVQRLDGTGHAFNVVHDHNGVVFLDGQSGHFAALDPAYARISLVSTGDREFPSAGLQAPTIPGPLVGTLSGGVPDFGKTFDGTSMGVEIELSGVSTSLDRGSARAFGHVASTDGTPLVMITKDMSTGDHPSRPNWKTHTLELVTYPVEVASETGVEVRKQAVLTLLDHLDTHLANGGGPLTSADLGNDLQLVVTNRNHEITSGSLDTDRQGTKIAMPVSMQQVTVGIRAFDITTSADPAAVAVRKAPWYDDSHTATAQSMLATGPAPAGVNVEQVTGAYTYVMSVIGFVARLVNDNKISIGDYYPADSTSTSLTDPKIKNAWAVLPRTKPIKMVHWLPAAEKAATLKLIRETPPPSDANTEAWRAARAYIVSQQGDVAGHGIDDATIGGEPAALFEHRTITPDVASFVPSRPEQVLVITDLASAFGDNRKTAVARAATEVSSPENATDFADWMRTQVAEHRANAPADKLIAQSAANQKMSWLAAHRPQIWQAMLAELAPTTRPAPAPTAGPRTAGQRPGIVATPVTAAEIAALRATTEPRTANTTSFDVVELIPTRTGVPDLVADSYRQAGLPVPKTSRPVINLGRIDGPVAYDHRLLSTDDGRTVRDFTVRVHLDPRDATATAQLDDTRRRAIAAVNAAYNQGFRIGDDQFHVTVEFTDDPADAHTTIALHGDSTPATTQTVWTTASSDLDLAHEIGHYLGLADENIDNVRVFNRDDTARHATDDSLMSTTAASDEPQILQRHLDRIAAAEEGAIGTTSAPDGALGTRPAPVTHVNPAFTRLTTRETAAATAATTTPEAPGPLTRDGYLRAVDRSLNEARPLAFVVNTVLPVSHIGDIPDMIEKVLAGQEGFTDRVAFVFDVNVRAASTATAQEAAVRKVKDAITALCEDPRIRDLRQPVAFVASTFDTPKFPAGTMRNDALHSPATHALLTAYHETGYHPYVSVQDFDQSSRLVSPGGPHVFNHFESLLAPESDPDAMDTGQTEPPFRPLMFAGGYRPDELADQIKEAGARPNPADGLGEQDQIDLVTARIHADMAARDAQAKVHPLLPYAPEPNLFVDGLAVLVEPGLTFGPNGAEFDQLAKRLNAFAAGELQERFTGSYQAAPDHVDVPPSTAPTTVEDVLLVQDKTEVLASVAVHAGNYTLPGRGSAFVVDFADGAVSTDLLRLARGFLDNGRLPQDHAPAAAPIDRFFDGKKEKKGTSFKKVADTAGTADYQTSEPLRPFRAGGTRADVAADARAHLGDRPVNTISQALARPMSGPFAGITYGIAEEHQIRAAYEAIAGRPDFHDQRWWKYVENEVVGFVRDHVTPPPAHSLYHAVTDGSDAQAKALRDSTLHAFADKATRPDVIAIATADGTGPVHLAHALAGTGYGANGHAVRYLATALGRPIEVRHVQNSSLTSRMETFTPLGATSTEPPLVVHRHESGWFSTTAIAPGPLLAAQTGVAELADRLERSTEISKRGRDERSTSPEPGPPTKRRELADVEMDLVSGPAATGDAQYAAISRLLGDPNRTPDITVLIDEALNFGHQTAGITLIESLRKLGHDRNITVVASPNVWQKLDRLLPLGTPGITRVTEAKFDPDHPYVDGRQHAGRLVLVGAADTLDETSGEAFLDYLGADQAIVFKPYAWQSTHRLAYHRTGPGEKVTAVDLDTIISPDAIYTTDVPVPDATTAETTIRAGLDPGSRADGLVTIAKAALADEIDVMPVYGLHRLDDELRPAAGLTLAHGVHAAGLHRPAVILEISDSRVDYAPATDNPPWLTAVDLGAGEQVDLTGLGPGDVVVVRTGGLPQDVFRTVYQLGSLPAVLEGANTANLVQLIGRPYFSPRPTTSAEATRFPRSGDPTADTAPISTLGEVTEAIQAGTDWSVAAKEDQAGPFGTIGRITTATSVLTSRLQAMTANPAEAHLTQEDFERLRDALPGSITDDAPQILGNTAVVAAAVAHQKNDYRQFEAGELRRIPITPAMIQQLRARLDTERATAVAEAITQYQQYSNAPSDEAVATIATAITELRNPDSALKQYFDRVATAARDPQRDQVLQGLSHYAATRLGITAPLGSQPAVSSHTEAEDQLRDTDYPFLLDVNPLREQGGELSTNCYVAAIATDMSLASGGIDRFQAGGAVASPSQYLSNYAGRPLDTMRDLDQVRDILTTAGPGARGIVTVQRHDGSGHAFNVVHDHNGVVFLDGQSGHFATLDHSYARISLVSTGDQEFPPAGLDTPATPAPLVSGGVPDFGKDFEDTSVGVEIELSGVNSSLEQGTARAFGYVASTDGTPLVMITKDMSTGDHPTRKNWKTHTLELVTYPVEVAAEGSVERRKQAVLTLLDHLETHLATGGSRPLTSTDLGDGLQLVVTNKNHEIGSGSPDGEPAATKIAMPVTMQQVTVGIRATDVATSEDPAAVAVRTAPWYNKDHATWARDELQTAAPGLDVARVAGAYTYVMSVIDFVAKLVDDHRIAIGEYVPPGGPSTTTLTDPKVKNAWAVLPRTTPITMVSRLPDPERIAALKLIRETPPPAANPAAWQAARAYIVIHKNDIAGHGIDDATIGGEPAALFEHRTITPDVASFVPSRPEQVVVITDLASVFGDNRKTAVGRAATEVSSPENATDFADWMRTQVAEHRANAPADKLIAQSAANQKMSWLAAHRPQIWQAMLADLAPTAAGPQAEPAAPFATPPAVAETDAPVAETDAPIAEPETHAEPEEPPVPPAAPEQPGPLAEPPAEPEPQDPPAAPQQQPQNPPAEPEPQDPPAAPQQQPQNPPADEVIAPVADDPPPSAADTVRGALPGYLLRNESLGMAEQIRATQGADIAAQVRALAPTITAATLAELHDDVRNDLGRFVGAPRPYPTMVNGRPAELRVTATLDFTGLTLDPPAPGDEETERTLAGETRAAHTNRLTVAQDHHIEGRVGIGVMPPAVFGAGLSVPTAPNTSQSNTQNVAFRTTTEVVAGGQTKITVPVTLTATLVDADGRIIGTRPVTANGSVGLSVATGLAEPPALPARADDAPDLAGEPPKRFGVERATARTGPADGTYFEQVETLLGELGLGDVTRIGAPGRTVLQQMFSDTGLAGNLSRSVAYDTTDPHKGWVTSEPLLRAPKGWRRLFPGKDRAIQYRTVARQVQVVDEIDEAEHHDHSRMDVTGTAGTSAERQWGGYVMAGVGADAAPIAFVVGPKVGVTRRGAHKQEISERVSTTKRVTAKGPAVRYQTVYELQVRVIGHPPRFLAGRLDALQWTTRDRAHNTPLYPDDTGWQGRTGTNRTHFGPAQLEQGTSFGGAIVDDLSGGDKVYDSLLQVLRAVPGNRGLRVDDDTFLKQFGDPTLARGLTAGVQAILSRDSAARTKLSNRQLRYLLDRIVGPGLELPLIKQGKLHDYTTVVTVRGTLEGLSDGELTDRGTIETDAKRKVVAGAGSGKDTSTTIDVGIDATVMGPVGTAGGALFGGPRVSHTWVKGNDIGVERRAAVDSRTGPALTEDGDVGAVPMREFAGILQVTAQTRSSVRLNANARRLSLGTPGRHLPDVVAAGGTAPKTFPLKLRFLVPEHRVSTTAPPPAPVVAPTNQAPIANPAPLNEITGGYPDDLDGARIESFVGLEHLQEAVRTTLVDAAQDPIFRFPDGRISAAIGEVLSPERLTGHPEVFSKPVTLANLTHSRRAADAIGDAKVRLRPTNPRILAPAEYEKARRGRSGGTSSRSRHGWAVDASVSAGAFAAISGPATDRGDHTSEGTARLAASLTPWQRTWGKVTEKALAGRAKLRTDPGPQRRVLVQVDVEAEIVAEARHASNLDLLGLGRPTTGRAGQQFTMPDAVLIWLTEDQVHRMRTTDLARDRDTADRALRQRHLRETEAQQHDERTQRQRQLAEHATERATLGADQDRDALRQRQATEVQELTQRQNQRRTTLLARQQGEQAAARQHHADRVAALAGLAPAAVPVTPPARQLPPVGLAAAGTVSYGIGGVASTVDLSDQIAPLRRRLAAELGEPFANALLPDSPGAQPHDNVRALQSFLADAHHHAGSAANGGQTLPLRLEGRWKGHTYHATLSAAFVTEPTFDRIEHVDELSVTDRATSTLATTDSRGRTLASVALTVVGQGSGTHQPTGAELTQTTGTGPGTVAGGGGVQASAALGTKNTKSTESISRDQKQSLSVSGPIATYRGSLRVDLTVTGAGLPAAGVAVSDTRVVDVHQHPGASRPAGPLGVAHRVRRVRPTRLGDDSRQRWRDAAGHDTLPEPGRFAVEHVFADLTVLHRAAEQALVASGAAIDENVRTAIRNGITTSTVKAGLAIMSEGRFLLPLPAALGRDLILDARLLSGPRFAGADADIDLEGSAGTLRSDTVERTAGHRFGIRTQMPIIAGGVNHPHGAKAVGPDDPQARHPFGAVNDRNHLEQPLYATAPDRMRKGVATRRDDGDPVLDLPVEDQDTDDPITRGLSYSVTFRFIARSHSTSGGQPRHQEGIELTVDDAVSVRMDDASARARTGEALPPSLRDAAIAVAEQGSAWTAAVRRRAGLAAQPAPDPVALAAADEAITTAETAWWDARATHDRELDAVRNPQPAVVPPAAPAIPPPDVPAVLPPEVPAVLPRAEPPATPPLAPETPPAVPEAAALTPAVPAFVPNTLAPVPEEPETPSLEPPAPPLEPPAPPLEAVTPPLGPPAPPLEPVTPPLQPQTPALEPATPSSGPDVLEMPETGRWATPDGTVVRTGPGTYTANGTPQLPGPAATPAPPHLARVFDSWDPIDGGQFTADHPLLSAGDEMSRALAYLDAGTPVLTTGTEELDIYDKEAGPMVPLTYRTDGRWIWTDALAYYLRTYALSPDDRLLADLRARNYQTAPVDAAAARRALAQLIGDPQEDSP